MAIFENLKRGLKNLGLVGLLSLSTIGCNDYIASLTKNVSHGAQVYQKEDGIIDQEEKKSIERILVHDKNPKEITKEELETILGFTNDVNIFQLKKAKENGYTRKSLKPVHFTNSADKNYIHRICKSKHAVACFGKSQNRIYISNSDFTDFMSTFFHELGHYQEKKHFLDALESVASFNRVYSNITVYQMDKEIGSFFVDKVFRDEPDPTTRVYTSFNTLNGPYTIKSVGGEYERAKTTGMIVLNHFNGDIEKAEAFFLSEPKDSKNIKRLFNNTLKRYPGEPILSIFFKEGLSALQKDGFVKSLMGNNYLTREEAEEYRDFLVFKLYSYVKDLSNSERYIENLDQKTRNAAERFLDRKHFTNQRFKNVALEYLVVDYGIDISIDYKKMNQANLDLYKKFVDISKDLPCNLEDKLTCPLDDKDITILKGTLKRIVSTTYLSCDYSNTEKFLEYLLARSKSEKLLRLSKDELKDLYQMGEYVELKLAESAKTKEDKAKHQAKRIYYSKLLKD